MIHELRQPRCARELRERLGVSRKAAETALRRLAQRGLARCLTPNLRQARLYGLTPIGKLMLREVAPGAYAVEPSAGLLAEYAFVQAGVYRRLVLRHLRVPTNARSLRQRILSEYRRIGANHVHHALREFAHRRLAFKRDSLWALSELGWQVRELAHGVIPRNDDAPAAWSGVGGVYRRP